MAKDQIPSDAEEIRWEGRRWPLLVVLIVVALLLATALTLGGRWAYRQIFEDQPTKQEPTKSETQNQQPEAETQNQSEIEAPAPPTGDDSEPLPSTGG
ncbi:hypothetical protein A3A68_01420 [Candidatus Saccharibacteria bacterium RIFCSPLOWO2_01_FULL_48_13]|nr:MAG: hypothetical protein A2884_00295 [Candidatus Saccharibacteria bacterium RIFCSPHIGHO2_01_FULL_48_12]OGL36794.1 MAG: hypothetical protein A3F38_02600 [Candidatus Saccharibacteria bacterium RIFCSPHIGHO2_12_FULL_48_21]OGL37373.1 MAG: hypothetical protein A3A68_01420 [Candidatus Saccharibacteria bacterium RIFCSPLOWO2_01_FULL_48_13]